MLFIGVLLLAVGIVAFNAWIIMLAWGAVAAQFGWTTLSYGASIGVSVLLGIIGGVFKRARS